MTRPDPLAQTATLTTVSPKPLFDDRAYHPSVVVEEEDPLVAQRAKDARAAELAALAIEHEREGRYDLANQALDALFKIDRRHPLCQRTRVVRPPPPPVRPSRARVFGVVAAAFLAAMAVVAVVAFGVHHATAPRAVAPPAALGHS